jgi:hypothetical protein
LGVLPFQTAPKRRFDQAWRFRNIFRGAAAAHPNKEVDHEKASNSGIHSGGDVFADNRSCRPRW